MLATSIIGVGTQNRISDVNRKLSRTFSQQKMSFSQVGIEDHDSILESDQKDKTIHHKQITVKKSKKIIFWTVLIASIGYNSVSLVVSIMNIINGEEE